MRLMLRLGFVREKKPVELSAAADGDGAVRWFEANLNVKTVISFLVFLGAIIAGYATIEGRLTRLETRTDAQEHATADITERRLPRVAQRISDETVSQHQYEHDTAQINQQLGQLEAGQQLILNQLLQRQVAR